MIMKKLFLFSGISISALFFSQEIQRDLSLENWNFKNSKDQQWLPAKVPGTVHQDLMNQQIIPDPYLDENEKKVQWVENENWDYQTTFTVSKDELKNNQADLVLEGLDTFAEVFVNGKSILKADNMFRAWEVPVKTYLKEGQNTLQIKFKSSVEEGKKLAAKYPFETPESPRSFVRKAQYQFGWDWGPRLVTAGIWKKPYLKFWNQAKVDFIQVEQKTLTANQSDLSFNMEVEVLTEGNYQVDVNGTQQQVSLHKGKNQLKIPYTVQQPKLWQPNGWGEAHLYTFKVKLIKDDKTIAQQEITHGFRTVELVQEKEKDGKSFYFKVNGKPLYAKGSNWIPGDSFLPRMTKEKYHQLIQDAKAAHMNMIRVWGGGAYEDEEFYKACDENGILVWQDFMFAGSFYPADEAFQHNVKEEVKYQVRRLQNHPSIALWCGNNEIDEAIVNWGYQKVFKYTQENSDQVWRDYRKIFEELIPNTLNEILPKNANFYWPTSPSIGWGHKESLTQGDSHYWGIWHGGFPFEIFNEKVGRFMSEYGFQGMPTLSTVKAMFSGKPELSLSNSTIKAHQKHGRGWAVIDEYMKRDYKIPSDFVQYNYVSQLLQARGMQIGIEAHRRNTPYNMGTLIWQLNDCWPVTSWSGVDYLGNWKAMQYQTKRSFQDQVLLAYEEGKTISFHAVNDELKTFSDLHLELKLYDFKGKELKTIHKNYPEAQLGNHLKLETFLTKDILGKNAANKVFLKAVLKGPNQEIITEGIHFFAKPKDLKLSQPKITVRKISDSEFEISTDILVKDLYLTNDAHFSDNFFNLLPGEKKIISSDKPIQYLEWMSLWDTLK